MDKDLDVSELFNHSYNSKKNKNKKRENETKVEYKKIDQPLKKEDNLDNNYKEKKVERTQYKELKKIDLKINNIKEKNESFLYNALFSFITILLFLTSIGNLLYTYYYRKNHNNIIESLIIILIALFYMLNAFIKNNGLKKFFGILTSFSIMSFIAFKLFII